MSNLKLFSIYFYLSSLFTQGLIIKRYISGCTLWPTDHYFLCLMFISLDKNTFNHPNISIVYSIQNIWLWIENRLNSDREMQRDLIGMGIKKERNTWLKAIVPKGPQLLLSCEIRSIFYFFFFPNWNTCMSVHVLIL